MNTTQNYLQPSALFPDFELPDQTGEVRKLSSIQAEDPLVLLLGRGSHCPREHQHQRSMVQFHQWCEVAYTQLVTITTDALPELNMLRKATGASWTFLSDADRQVQKTLNIQEYTDPVHDPMVPHTVILLPGLIVEKVYVGYWFWGRPSPYDLWQDLREVSMRIRTDFDLYREEQ